MLEINTIADFQALPGNVQNEVLRSIKAKERLDIFLRSQNKKAGPKPEPHWAQCKGCLPEKPGVCRHCATWGQAGWVWKVFEGRDASDIHPSQIAKCMKALWYACNGFADFLEEYVDPRIQMIFSLGHAWHDVMQGYGRRGAWCEPGFYHHEVQIDPDAVTFDGQPVLPLAKQFWIRGAADALIDKYLITVPGVGEVSIRLVHEYKTMNSNNYTKLIRPKPEHKHQATIYSAVFDAPIVVYLYTNKDTCDTKDFPVAFDSTIWASVTEKISQVQHYTELEQMPPWELTAAANGASECKECGYRKICVPPSLRPNESTRRFGA
jgi:CRISPR/Cas system-associated exonuclease Cas4 (RecB family)